MNKTESLCHVELAAVLARARGALTPLTSRPLPHLFQMHWTIAMSVSPVIMLILLLSVIVLVEVLWFCVLALDKRGAALGIRKSPLV